MAIAFVAMQVFYTVDNLHDLYFQFLQCSSNAYKIIKTVVIRYGMRVSVKYNLLKRVPPTVKLSICTIGSTSNSDHVTNIESCFNRYFTYLNYGVMLKTRPCFNNFPMIKVNCSPAIFQGNLSHSLGQ